jgi:hypothetical protein
MTDEEKERWYDEEVAPQLKALAERCNEAGLCFFAVVRFGPGQHGVTWAMPEKSTEMVMLRHCEKMGLNIDGYIYGLLRWAKENGVDYMSSIVMQQAAGKGLFGGEIGRRDAR